MDEAKAFGDRLRELRIAADRSMGEVARWIDVSITDYSKVENGQTLPWEPATVNYHALAQILGCDADELLDVASQARVKTIPVDEQRLRVAVAFLHREFRNDGAEGESVHRVCADALMLLEQLTEARSELVKSEEAFQRLGHSLGLVIKIRDEYQDKDALVRNKLIAGWTDLLKKRFDAESATALIALIEPLIPGKDHS